MKFAHVLHGKYVVSFRHILNTQIANNMKEIWHFLQEPDSQTLLKSSNGKVPVKEKLLLFAKYYFGVKNNLKRFLSQGIGSDSSSNAKMILTKFWPTWKFSQSL